MKTLYLIGGTMGVGKTTIKDERYRTLTVESRSGTLCRDNPFEIDEISAVRGDYNLKNNHKKQ